MRNPLGGHPPWRQLAIIAVVLPLIIVLGVLAFAFVTRPEPSEPELRFLSTLAGLTEGMWGSPDELAGLWGAEARFEPELPVELTDAVYAGWRRAVERSRGWAG